MKSFEAGKAHGEGFKLLLIDQAMDLNDKLTEVYMKKRKMENEKQTRLEQERKKQQAKLKVHAKVALQFEP